MPRRKRNAPLIDAIYETTVYTYGKRRFVTGRYASADHAWDDAKHHFRGKVTVRSVRLVRDLSPAGAVVTDEPVEKK